MILALLTACTGVVGLGNEGTVSSQDTGTAPEPVACEDTVASNLVAQASWTVPLDGYGDWGGIHQFSIDGEELVTAVDVYNPQVLTIQTADGSVEVELSDIYPWNRDDDWTIEVRGTLSDGGAVVDLTDGETLLSGEAFGNAWTGGHGVVSGDGRRVVAVSCDEMATRVRAWDVPSRQLLTDLTVADTCDWTPPGPAQVAVNDEGTVAYVGLVESGEIMRVDLEEGTADLWQAHAADIETEIWISMAVMSVTLTSDEEVLVTVGADGWLRQWATSDLTQVGEDLPAQGTVVNENIYATPGLYSPVAGSPDGTLLASVADTGHLVVRRACDGQQMVELPSPEATDEWSSDPGPVAVDFHPSGESLAVRYENLVVYWTLHSE
jgi:WD40 repeat protein